MRLRRSRACDPGIRRVRSGRGFRYTWPDGRPVRDRPTLDRIRALVLPPAWEDVWICPEPNGHLQATGVDSAGRRQYRYHDEWRAQRDREKHERMQEFARALPRMREITTEHLGRRGFTRERVLAGAVRLLDLGFFRSGSDAYEKENETFGLATIRREHVSVVRGTIRFEYSAKGSKVRVQAVAEDSVRKLVRGLLRRKDDGPELLAYREGGTWHDVTAADINAYLREVTGGSFTAKDFRTWHATVLAAAGLAVSTEVPDTRAAKRRAVTRVVKEVADYLGDTPAVTRRSYIDPRVISAFENGRTVARAVERIGEGVRPGELATIGHFEKAVARMVTSRHGGSR
ncbi:MAG TPA: DNA topoisomerase IB [Sporichthya sp.]|nr:DNA topoisomerase IB [Sporichthya sp.]